MKFVASHCDTCLPDFWSGHHLPHVQILAYPGMSLDDIKDALRSEINEGAIAGSVIPDDQPEEWHEALLEAVDEIEPKNTDQTTFFDYLEEPDDVFCDSVYAFFVFVPEDEE